MTGPKPLPRSEVAKKLWVYIKKNGLQDQKNKRMINADDVLKAVKGHVVGETQLVGTYQR